MRKSGLLAVMLTLLMLMSMTIPAITQDNDTNSTLDPLALSVYFSQDTLIYATLRTDDAFIDTLDGILARIGEFIPDAELPLSLPMLLDLAAGQATGQDFDSSFGTWLGDSAAIGLGSIDSIDALNGMEPPPALGVIEITDRQGAEAYLRTIADNAPDRYNLKPDTSSGYTILSASMQPLAIAVSDDVMLISTAPELLPLTMPESSLSSNPDFVAAIDALPESAYNTVIYLDTAEMQRINQAGIPSSDLMQQLNALAGVQAWGFTIRNGDVLIADVYAKTAGPDAMAELGITTYTPQAVELAFADRIPADVPLLIHSTDFGPTTQNALDIIRGLSAVIEANGGLAALIGNTSDMDPDAAEALKYLDLGSLVAFTNISFAGLTGLSLERDVLPWMNGDSITALRFTAGTGELMALPDFAMFTETSDQQAASYALASMVDAAGQYGTAYSQEALGTGEALVLPVIREALSLDQSALDLMVGSSDDLFYFGTRDLVNDIINTEAGLGSTDGFRAASEHFLPGAQQVWYFNSAPIVSLIETLVTSESVDYYTQLNLLDVRQALALIESASITAVNGEDAGTGRMVLSLADALPEPIIIEDPFGPTVMPDMSQEADPMATEAPDDESK